MNNIFLNKIRSSHNQDWIDRAIITLFVDVNNIKIKKNTFIKSFLIDKKNKEYITFYEEFKKYNNEFSFEDLIQSFEVLIPNDEKIINGAVYTPDYIKDFIVNFSIRNAKVNEIENAKFADISCGCGAFLYTIAKKIRKITNKNFSDIFKNQIYGMDICKRSVQRSKAILTLLAINEGDADIRESDFNIYQGNSLTHKWSSNVDKKLRFDYVIGNPPYVRTKNLDGRIKKSFLEYSVAKGGNCDLYIPFFELGLKLLKPGGKLGYITVNSFFKSVNARELRKYFSKNKFDIKILDFGNEQIFNNKSTYTCMCFIQNKKSNGVSFCKTNSVEIKQNPDKSNFNFNNINYTVLDNWNGWLLNSVEILENIHKIEDIGIKLGKKYEIRNGLATLKNNIYIFKPQVENKKYYEILYDNKIFKIEKDICRNIIKPNIIKNEKCLIDKLEKIIFPYTFVDNAYNIIPENKLKKDYPNTYKYLLYNRNRLSKRDKGLKEYSAWYAFGRMQGLNITGIKLLFPYIANTPRFIYSEDTNLMFYCGYAILADTVDELKILKIILNSKVFSYYIKNTSKPYSGGFYSLAKNYVKNFGLCELSIPEKEFLLKSKDKEIDKFLIKKYDLNI